MRTSRLAAIWARASCALLSLACTGDTSPIESTTTPATTSTTWVQVANDEFDGPAGAPVDASRWSYDTADGCKEGICGWGNEEKQYYTNAAENVALNGQGQLMIVARRAPPGLACHYGACRYTSGKVTTRGKLLVSPGRVEARIKLPAGQGLWSAFWMLGHRHPTTPWPTCGELDIIENKGSEPTTTSSAVHGPNYSGTTPFARSHVLPAGSNPGEFHVYAIEWDAAAARFFVDGVAHYTVTRADVERAGRWVFDQPFYLILNLAVGGKFDGDPGSNEMFPATMLVDYVRVYTAAAR